MTRKRRLILVSILLLSVLSVFLAILPITGVYAQPEVEWDNVFYDSSGYLIPSDVLQTTDEGYAILATTGGGPQQFFLIKTDSEGNEVWRREFGGPEYDAGFSFLQTSDGGYIITGTYDLGDPPVGRVWLIKTDSDGSMVWEKMFGGTENDWGYSVQQTNDGGYIISGFTTIGAGSCNVYLIKTDFDGNKQWEKTFGGTGSHKEVGKCVQQTIDGGYIIAGDSLIKTDSDGSLMWKKPYGGNYVQLTIDGGYIILGDSLIKTDSDGSLMWEKPYGGNCVQQTIDGGYIIAGDSLIKTDSDGSLVWEKIFDPLLYGDHSFMSVKQTTDIGYIIVVHLWDHPDYWGPEQTYLGKLEPESIWSLRELKEDVTDLPDDAFKRTKYARFWRKTLLKKLTVEEKLVKRGNYRAARRMLERSLKRQIMKRIRQPWKSGLLEWVDYTINNIPYR